MNRPLQLQKAPVEWIFDEEMLAYESLRKKSGKWQDIS